MTSRIEEAGIEEAEETDSEGGLPFSAADIRLVAVSFAMVEPHLYDEPQYVRYVDVRAEIPDLEDEDKWKRIGLLQLVSFWLEEQRSSTRISSLNST